MKFQAVGTEDVTGLSAGDEIAGRAPLAHPPTAALADHPSDCAGARAYDTAQIRDLRLEVDRLRTERAKLLDTHQQIMALLGTRSPDKVIHDLRNLLNERDLYRTLCDIDSRPE